MTGHRRGTGKPLGRDATQKRRADHARQRLTNATTPTQVVTAVLDHARAVVTHTPVGEARRLAERIARAVLTETTTMEGRSKR